MRRRFSQILALGIVASALAITGGALAAPTPTLNPPVARDSGVDLSWSTSAGAISYKVFRGTVAAFTCTTPVATVTTTSYTDVGLLNRATYFYKVIATDGSGDSACSNEVSATPAVAPYNWDFNRAGQSLEDWGGAVQLTPTVTLAGKLSLAVTGTDPQIFTADGLGVDPTQFTSFEIRMSNGSSSTSARISWITDTDGVYDANKSKTFTISPNSGDTTYSVTGLPASWSGRIKRIRFEPQEPGVSGTTSTVDSFKLVTAAAATEPLTGAIYFSTEDQTNNVFHPASFTDFDHFEQFAGRYSGDSTDRVKIMEQEIDYAANAGIDYFSFEWTGQTFPHPADRIQDFRNAANKNRMKYTVMVYGGFSGFYVGAEPYPADKNRWEAIPGGEAEELKNLFLDPEYLKIEGNRPVIHWWNAQSLATQNDGFGPCGGSNGCWLDEINFLRNLTTAAGLGSPYFVDSSYSGIDMNRAAGFGFDSASSYGNNLTSGCCGRHTGYAEISDAVKAHAATYSTTGVRLHPPVSGLRDKRARNCQDSSLADYMVDMPTYGQWEDSYRFAYESLQQYPGRSSNPGIMLMYAWNEQEESGQGMVPTLHEATSFVDAIQSVQTGAYPATYYDWINDSMLPPDASGNGIKPNRGIKFVGGAGPNKKWTWSSAVQPACPSGPPYSHSSDKWGFYGNDETSATNTNNSATLVAELSTGFRYIAATGPDRGKVNVQIDGGTATTVDLYTPTLLRQRKVYEIIGLTQGTHTIKLTVTGTKNAASSGVKVGVDAIRVQTVRPTLAAPTPTPEAPTRLVASREHNRVDLSWDRVPGATSYNVYRGTTNNFTPGTPLAMVSEPTTADSKVRYLDSSALNGTKYFYVVRVNGGTATSSQAQAIPIVSASFGRPASASSTSGSNVPANAVDGDLTTHWSPVTGNSGEFLQVDLAAPTTINRFYLKELVKRVNNFKIQISTNNGSSFTDLYNGTAIADGDLSARSISVKVAFGVTNVRFTLTSAATGGAPQIAEFQTYLR